MTSDRFEQLRRSFEQLLELPPDERDQSLAEISRQDAALSAELRKMLKAHDEVTALLDRPILRSPEDLLADATQLGPYRLQREVGRGGMGNVYEAVRVDGNFSKRVAIKILRRDVGGGRFLGRFNRERQILARLEHPHIAGILDAGETEAGDPYFVMEFVDGIPITNYARIQSLSTGRKLDLFLQVCDAVQYAHRNLTVHRDLKPSNILVTSAGAVKLLDFGIAKLIEADQETADGPPTEAVMTPAYTSPEQIRREPATTATDVFQLGILLYELLAGRHPFQPGGRLPHEVMRAICEDDPPNPSSVATQDARRLRGELDTIVLTALRKEPSWRYASVEQMADDIGRYRRGWPVLAHGNGASYRLRKFARRQWLPLGAGALLLISLAAGMIATAYQARLAERARASADRAREQAEQQEVRADYQRLAAEQAQRNAIEQRRLAETRTQEAEIERNKEQKRYREVRALASSLLFDLNDGIRDLAGSSTARRLIVTKVQRQLELLSAEAGDDIGLQRDLAACYERMGELRMDPRGGKNDAAAAIDAYQKGVDLRRSIAARPDAQLADHRDLARSLSKLGDGQFLSGAAKPAIASYASSRTLAQSLLAMHREDASIQQALGTVDGRRCAALMATGDSSGAVQACEEGLSFLTPLAEVSGSDLEVQHAAATTNASYANALRLTGRSQDALKYAKVALDSFHHLEYLAPNNAEYRRLDSSAELILASSLSATNNLSASLEAYQRSVHAMQLAVEIDPSDLGSPLRLAFALRAFSQRLSAAGNRDEAHDAAKEALQLLKTTSEKPGAGPVEWNDYADALLKVEWPDLRQWPEALQLAQAAVAGTQRKNPICLDTLAWAYYRNGNAQVAIATEREALGLLPKGAQNGLHDELEVALNTFLAGGSGSRAK
jgi:serine/threonine protein kinase